jgi:hypothetical protein
MQHGLAWMAVLILSSSVALCAQDLAKHDADESSNKDVARRQR